MYPQKGTIAIGSDADIALWDPTQRVTLTNDILQHGADYTPYEGLEIQGWPVRLLVRGQTIMERGSVVDAGQGQYQSRKRSNLTADTNSAASVRP
jgi:dihydropyrimidinase